MSLTKRLQEYRKNAESYKETLEVATKYLDRIEAEYMIDKSKQIHHIPTKEEQRIYKETKKTLALIKKALNLLSSPKENG